MCRGHWNDETHVGAITSHKQTGEQGFRRGRARSNLFACDILAAEVTCASAGQNDPLVMKSLRRANTNGARFNDNRREDGFTESLPLGGG